MDAQEGCQNELVRDAQSGRDAALLVVVKFCR